MTKSFYSYGKIFLLFFLIFSSTHCTYIQETIGWGLSRPTIKLKSIYFKKVKFTQIDIETKLEIQNPNQFDMKLSEISYELSAEKILFAKGQYLEKLVIPSKGSLQVKFPLSIDINKTFEIAKLYLRRHQKEVMSRWDASFKFSTPLGDLKMEFQDEKPLK